MDGPLESYHKLAVVSSKITEHLRLLSKDVNHGVGRFAIFKPVDDSMLDQVSPCSVLEFI